MTTSGILLLLLGIALSAPAEAKDIPLDDVPRVLLDYQEMPHDQLIRDVRLSRALNALLTERLLAASGVMVQGILRNPIAEPSVPGITRGSVMFATIAPMLPLLTAAGNLWAAPADAGLSGLLVFPFTIKYTGRPDISHILLAGSALSIFFLSAVSLSTLMQNHPQELAFQIIGSLRQADWDAVIGLGIVALVYTDSLLLLGGKVNLPPPDSEIATSFDIDTAGLKKKVILVMIPLCAMCVTIAGNISFVRLFVPHILRGMSSQDICHTLPLSFLFGSVLMVFSDVAARISSVSYELPVGLFTALPGIPVFLLLMRRECG